MRRSFAASLIRLTQECWTFEVQRRPRPRLRFIQFCVFSCAFCGRRNWLRICLIWNVCGCVTVHCFRGRRGSTWRWSPGWRWLHRSSYFFLCIPFDFRCCICSWVILWSASARKSWIWSFSPSLRTFWRLPACSIFYSLFSSGSICGNSSGGVREAEYTRACLSDSIKTLLLRFLLSFWSFASWSGVWWVPW